MSNESEGNKTEKMSFKNLFTLIPERQWNILSWILIFFSILILLLLAFIIIMLCRGDLIIKHPYFHSRNSYLNSVPIGTIVAWPSDKLNIDGWRLCNGELIEKKEYKELYNTIGDAFANEDNPPRTVQFNLPDLRGMFVRGLDKLRGIDKGRTIGSTQKSFNKKHTHTATQEPHSHKLTAGGNAEDGIYSYQRSSGAFPDLKVPVSEDATPIIAVQFDKEGKNESRPINIALNWIIKVCNGKCKN